VYVCACNCFIWFYYIITVQQLLYGFACRALVNNNNNNKKKKKKKMKKKERT